MTSVIVVGAGLGGIALAGRLARLGYDITVYEKRLTPGGRVEVIEKDGFRFDAGPTLFLMPDVFRQAYSDLGERMEDHLDLIRLDPTYRVHFHDGSILDLTYDMVSMRQQLDRLEPGAFNALLRFLAQGYQHYYISLEKFVGRNFYSLADYFSPANLPLLFQLKALQKHARHVGKFFKDPRLLAAFSFQNMYLGVSPYDAPATYTLLQYIELVEGVWFPRGGLFRTVETMQAIAEKLGVRFEFNAPVQRIDVDSNRATGVTLKSGERLHADIVIANADLPYAYSELLPVDGATRRLQKKKYTSSALMFFWGLKGERSPELLHHNVFLSDHRYQPSFDKIFNEHTLPDEPSFYLNAPSRTDPSFAPPDGDGIMALVPVGHIDEKRTQDWKALEDKARSFIFEKLKALGLGEIQPRLVSEVKWGPPYYQNALNLVKGSAFGLSHNFLQVGYLRPHNRHARYPNLYFVGASTHPGTGLPIVLLSARLVAERLSVEIPPALRQTVSASKPVTS